MVVSEDMEVTRASVISSNPFNTDGTGFNLYGFHGSGMMWTGAKPYSRTSGVWGGAGDWPSTSGACYFYALSYAGSNTASGNVTDEPDGDSFDAVSFDYELPNSSGALTLASQEDLLVAHSVTKTGDTYGTDLVGQTSGDVNLNFSHALANLEIKAIMPTEGYDEDSDNGKYDENLSVFGKDCFMYIKSITIHNLPIGGTYTYGAPNPWAANTTKANAVISFPKGKYLAPKSYNDDYYGSTGQSTGVATYYGSDNARKAAEHALYDDIATGDASIMIIPHSTSIFTPSSTDTFTDEEDAIYVEVNYCIAQVANTGGGAADFTDGDQFDAFKAFVDDLQGSGADWNFVDGNNDPCDLDEAMDNLFQNYDTKPYYGWSVSAWLGDNVPVQTGAGFFCGSSNSGAVNSHYIKFKSTINFLQNKKYTLYIDFNNLLTNEGGVAIDPT